MTPATIVVLVAIACIAVVGIVGYRCGIEDGERRGRMSSVAERARLDIGIDARREQWRKEREARRGTPAETGSDRLLWAIEEMPGWPPTAPGEPQDAYLERLRLHREALDAWSRRWGIGAPTRPEGTDS